jgi:hypothetical protein
MKQLTLTTANNERLIVTSHPATGAILAGYPVGTVIQIADGQAFVVGHRASLGLVLVPITDTEAERLCGLCGEPTPNSNAN